MDGTLDFIKSVRNQVFITVTIGFEQGLSCKIYKSETIQSEFSMSKIIRISLNFFFH